MTIGKSDMLSWAPPIIFIYLVKVGKHPSSNGFMSLIQKSHFPVLSCAHNLLSCSNFEGLFGRYDNVMTIRGSDTLSAALQLITIYLRDAMKYSSYTQTRILLQHSVTFPRLIWCPKIDILLEIEVFI